MESLKDIQEIQNKITRAMEDPLAKILIKNSRLTKIQLETLLIDILANNTTDIKTGYEQKSKMRLSKPRVSRGAFNHTLRQAKKNVTQTINTILLLGYLGILDTPKLSPFIEASNKLNEYMETYEGTWKEVESKTFDKNKLNTISLMEKELEYSLLDLNLVKTRKK
jgi:hypothetical protein